MSHRSWTHEDLEYLNDNYGVLPDSVVARRLRRSPNALKIAAYRKLGINRKTNIYTSREVARICGLCCAKTVIDTWVPHGFIVGKKGALRCGNNVMWSFTYEAIENMLRKYPWLLRRDAPKSYFSNIVAEERERDPWYNRTETAKIVGVNQETLSRYIKRGALQGIKIPGGKRHGPAWLFRRSAIEAFQLIAPDYSAYARARRKHILTAGQPLIMHTTWLLICPRCGEPVRIKAPARINGPAVKRTFIEVFTNGTCNHGRVCVIREVKDATRRS